MPGCCGSSTSFGLMVSGYLKAIERRWNRTSVILERLLVMATTVGGSSRGQEEEDEEKEGEEGQKKRMRAKVTEKKMSRD